MLSADDLIELRQKVSSWPDDYPPCVDDLLAHIDHLAGVMAADRELAAELRAANGRLADDLLAERTLAEPLVSAWVRCHQAALAAGGDPTHVDPSDWAALVVALDALARHRAARQGGDGHG